MRPLIHGWMLVCLIVLSSMFTSACTTPISTVRPSPRWDVDGTWSINQSNGFFITFVVLLVTLVGQGGSLPYLIKRMHVKDDGANDMEERVALAKTAHVALTPGKDFGPAHASTYFRLSFATSMPQLQETVRRLARELDR